MIDDESEPGSWKLALELGPWRRIGKNTYTNEKNEMSETKIRLLNKTSELFEESDEDVKREILFSLCKTQKVFSSKIIKLLSSILKMRKETVSDYLEEAVEQIDLKTSRVSEEHSYSSMFKAGM